MSNLIEQLKIEHMELVESLKEAHKLGIVNEEGRKKLMSMKEKLLSHMKKEDDELYPSLNRAADKDENFRVALDYFTANMHEISVKALSFFEKYASGGNKMEFIRDYKDLLTVLTERIDKEETILFGEFYKRGL